MRALLALLLLTLLGCPPISTIGSYNRDPSICSRSNARGVRVVAVLQDDWQPIRHTQYVGNVDPGGHICTSWSMPGAKGRWGYVVRDRDTTWDAWFQAWALR